MDRSMKAAVSAEEKSLRKTEKFPVKGAPKFLSTFKKSAMCSQSDGAKFGPVTSK